jgi:hypothetical protein
MSKHYAYWYLLLAVIALIAGMYPMILSGTFSPLPVVATLVVAIVLPPILIWVMQRLGYSLGKPVSCPNCGTEMPLFRKPSGMKQGLWGGYTCPKCGTEMDARGRARS